jgi:general secretion pathway protein I
MRGFTLLEVMIALAIMAGVILTVITSFNTHLSLAAADREQTVAVLLARSKLEDPDFKKGQQKSGTFAPDWPEIVWEAETTGVEIPEVQRLTLTVNWDDKKKKLALVQYLEPDRY